MRRASGDSNRRERRLRWAGTLFALACCGYLVDSPAGLAAPPPEPLASEKLQPWGKTGLWLCAEERQLRRDLASLNAHRQEIEELQEVLAKWVRANAGRWAVSRGALQDAPAGQAKSPDATSVRGPGVAVDPARIGDLPPVRQKVIQLANVRIQLSMTLSRIRRLSSQMTATYERLDQDQAIHEALVTLGDDQRLGPASDYATELRRLRDYFPLAETSWVPAYLQGQHLRFSGICNERAPATFTWSPELTSALVSTGSFQAAGLQLPPEATLVPIQYHGSTIDVYRIQVPYLQFGSCLFRDVPAYLLPPESEYLGNRIGGSALEGYRVVPDPTRLRVSFETDD